MYFEICQDLYYKNFMIVYLEGAMSWYAKMYFSGDREIFQILSLWTGTKSLKTMSKYGFSVMHGRAKVNKNMSSALNLEN